MENVLYGINKDDCDHHDYVMLDFALPTPEHVLGLTTGKHIFFSDKINGHLVIYRYTTI